MLRKKSKAPATYPYRFLLDENVDARIEKYLRHQGYIVKTCPKGAPDTQVFSMAQKQSLILLTNDSDFANMGIYPPNDKSAVIIFKVHPPELLFYKKILNTLITFESQNLFGKTFIASHNYIEILS